MASLSLDWCRLRRSEWKDTWFSFEYLLSLDCLRICDGADRCPSALGGSSVSAMGMRSIYAMRYIGHVKVVGASLSGAMAALAPSQRSGRERPLPSTPPSPHTADH